MYIKKQKQNQNNLLLHSRFDHTFPQYLAEPQKKHFHLSSQRPQLFLFLNIPLLVGT